MQQKGDTMLNARSPSSSYIQPTLGHALRVWWAFYWRSTLFGFVIVFVISLLLGIAGRAAGLSQPLILLAARVESLVVTFIVTLFAMQRVLRKNFQRFRIGLASRTSPSSEPQYFEPTLGRALRVWWAYFWRMIFLLVVAFVVVGLPLNAFLGLFGPSLIFVQFFSVVMWAVIVMLVSTYVLWYKILDEDIADFHVTLIPREAAPPVPAADAVPQ